LRRSLADLLSLLTFNLR